MYSRQAYRLWFLFIFMCITTTAWSTHVVISSHLEQLSRQFLGKPYLLGALGEGAQGRYDQSPIVRMDAFDCETFVDTVLALAYSADAQTFQQCIRKIRYENGVVDYFHRNHFTSLDWNHNNQKQGFLKDITHQITNAAHHSVALTARAIIDKPNWYQHKSLQDIKLNNKNTHLQAERLAELKRRGKKFAIITTAMPYLPLRALFDANGNANKYLFAQIPDGAIIEIVRPNWDLTKIIGSHLNVSHMGFAFRIEQTLLFRNASSQAAHVIDVNLIDYLRDQIKSPTIKGINVQILLPGKACGLGLDRQSV